MATKKVVLQKQIQSTLYDIFPKTDATIVQFIKGTGNEATTTTVAAELAALASTIDTNNTNATQAIQTLRNDVFGILGDGESIASTFDTIKEIADFLDTHDESIGALAGLITDVGVASAAESSPGAGDAVTATGLHADVEDLQADVAALQAANGTNVSKTKTGSDPAGNGQVYLDGTLTTIYSDTDVWAALGTSSDSAAAAGTTAWSRIKQAESDIDSLESGLGTSGDTASASGTTAWARIKALESINPVNVAASSTNGNIIIDNTETQVFDDSDLWSAIGTSSDTANAAGTTAWSRIKQAESDISSLESGLGTSGDTASASGSTAWSRILAIQAEADPVQLVASLPASPDPDVLYMVELQ